MSIEARPAEGRAPARIGWQDLLICGAALAALALPTPVGEAPELVRAVALVIFAIGYWATGRMPEHVVALVFFLAAMLLSVAPPQVIFAGFAAPAFWLVVGGLIIGGAVDYTGFGQRLARFMVGRAAGSYAKMIAAILVVDLALAFIMPSTMGRVALLLPIAMAIAGEAGFRPGQKGWNGIVLATVFGSYMGPTTILTANVPNNILLGAADSLHGIKITYFEYLGVHFPILGLLKTLILGLVIIVFLGRPAGARADRQGTSAVAAGGAAHRDHLGRRPAAVDERYMAWCGAGVDFIDRRPGPDRAGIGCFVGAGIRKLPEITTTDLCRRYFRVGRDRRRHRSWQFFGPSIADRFSSHARRRRHQFWIAGVRQRGSGADYRHA